jgi:membrane protein DedA with SNARE-associated domain
VSLLSPDTAHLLEQYGYAAVALAVAIESVGVPFPGETTLIAAAIYAGTGHRMSITGVVVAAAFGAIMGDNIGFWIGRGVGYRVLLRYGSYIRLTERRIKLGQYLFLRHGGKVVFFGRFIAVLRALAAVLAGVNRMAWPHFLAFNAAGGIAWAALYGLGSYFLGEQVHRVLGSMGIWLLAAAAIMTAAGFVFLRRYEEQLANQAEAALPGPLAPVRHGRPTARIDDDGASR